MQDGHICVIKCVRLYITMEIIRNDKFTIVIQDTIDEIQINGFIDNDNILALTIKDTNNFVSLEVDATRQNINDIVNDIYPMKCRILGYLRNNYRIDEYHIIQRFFNDFLKNVEKNCLYFLGRYLVEDGKIKTYTEKF